MNTFLLFADINRLWYSIPLIVVISLVYGATRHELRRPIFEHAFRFGAWIVGFMAILGVVMWFFSRRL
jgi:hypothetical protein